MHERYLSGLRRGELRPRAARPGHGPGARDPARIGRGDEPSRFLLRCNISKQLWTREIFWKLEGVRVTYPHPSWPSGARVEHHFTKDGIWTAEIAIPLGSLKAADLKDGEEWGLLLARDYSAADQNAIVQSSDWRFGDGRRHFGRAFYNNYRLEKEYARAVLRAGAPAVQLLSLGDLIEGRIAPSLAVKNTGNERQRVTVRLEMRIAYDSRTPDTPGPPRATFAVRAHDGRRRLTAGMRRRVPRSKNTLQEF